jgi:hypothetical protein
MPEKNGVMFEKQKLNANLGGPERIDTDLSRNEKAEDASSAFSFQNCRIF